MADQKLQEMMDRELAMMMPALKRQAIKMHLRSAWVCLQLAAVALKEAARVLVYGLENDSEEEVGS